MSSARKFNVPPCVTVDQVVGLVEVLHSLGGSADASKISEIMDMDAGMLPNVIDVAEALGLLTHSKGDLIITNLGVEVARADSRSLKRILGGLVDRIEPLATILRILRERGGISRADVENILEEAYGKEKSRALECLTHWGTYLGVFRWNDDGQILRPSGRRSRS